MDICLFCIHYNPNDLSTCDILDKFKGVADTYELELSVKVNKCLAYKKR